jgi:hypothetical protein
MGPGKENYVIPLPSVLGIDVASLLGTSWHMLSIVSDGSKNECPLWTEASW